MVEALFHGHSFIEIVNQDFRIFIDPFITGNPSCDLTLDEAINRKPTHIVITHGHSDHIGDSIHLATNTGAQVISTFEVVTRLEKQGIQNTSAQHIGGEVAYDSINVKFTPALHGGQIADSNICGVAAGVIIRLGGKIIYHAGDTGLTKEFELLGEYESIDLAFLPIGDRFTMGPDDAVIATNMIRPKYVVPIHYNTRDLIRVDPIDFARKIMLKGIAVPKVLKSGQMIVLE